MWTCASLLKHVSSSSDLIPDVCLYRNIHASGNSLKAWALWGRLYPKLKCLAVYLCRAAGLMAMLPGPSHHTHASNTDREETSCKATHVLWHPYCRHSFSLMQQTHGRRTPCIGILGEYLLDRPVPPWEWRRTSIRHR